MWGKNKKKRKVNKKKKGKNKWENGNKKKTKTEKKKTRGDATVLSLRVLEYLLIIDIATHVDVRGFIYTLWMMRVASFDDRISAYITVFVSSWLPLIF
jgi:hypothetical protein